jgi:hypothetical protein
MLFTDGISAVGEVIKTSKKEFLNILASLYSEHRSDVSEIVEEYLEGNGFHADYREHRYVKILHGGEWITYDTLTTITMNEDGEEFETNFIDD